MRLVALDKRVFQNEGFKLGRGDDDVKVAHLLDHRCGFRLVLAAKVARHAVFEFFGFADVDDLALFVQHEVDPWQKRQAVCLVAQVVYYRSSRLPENDGSIVCPKASPVKRKTKSLKTNRFLCTGKRGRRAYAATGPFPALL